MNKANSSWSPLHWAYRGGYLEIIEFLLANVPSTIMVTQEPEGLWSPTAIGTHHGRGTNLHGARESETPKIVNLESTLAGTNSSTSILSAKRHGRFWCNRCYFVNAWLFSSPCHIGLMNPRIYMGHSFIVFPAFILIIALCASWMQRPFIRITNENRMIHRMSPSLKENLILILDLILMNWI